MSLGEALNVAAHPVSHDLPTLWEALRTLAPIVERVKQMDTRFPPTQVVLGERATYGQGWREGAHYALTGEA